MLGSVVKCQESQSILETGASAGGVDTTPASLE